MESGGQLKVGIGSSEAGGGVSPSLGGSAGVLEACVAASPVAERTAAVALLIITRKLTDRELSAFEITLIDSKPPLDGFPNDSKTATEINIF